MTITYNGTTYVLTTAQAQALRYAAMQPSGAFYMERRNDATEAKLTAMGLLEEGYAYRDAEERGVKVDSIRLDLQRALTALEGTPDITTAEDKAGDAMWELRALLNTRRYLTEAGYAVVLRAFPLGVAVIPARFRHLVADMPVYTPEVK